MATERITFTGHLGDELAARLDMPDGPHRATALFAHCFTCSKDIAAARRIASQLTGIGIAVLRFDFTGLGHSQGEFSNTTFSSNVGDLVAAADYLAARDMAPSLIIGHSLGGAAVLRATGDIPSVKAVVTIAAPFDPGHVTRNFAHALSDIEANGSAQVDLGGREFTIGRDFVRDIAAENLAPAIANLKRALLVLHAPLDAHVGVENASQIFLAAKHPKSFVTLDDADHLISRAKDADYAAQVIAAWVARYLGIDQSVPPVGAPEGPPAGIVRVTEADAAGFLQYVNAGPHHHALADEPVSLGGSNRGMTPHGFLSAGLGACTSITIRMYVRRKNWLLDHISVDVTHHKESVEDPESNAITKVNIFTRTIRLTGDLSDTQRQKILAIANKCPVHRTLEQNARVHSELV